MAIKVYNPTSPGRRDASTLVNQEITKRDPEKSLIIYKKKRAGRNNEGGKNDCMPPGLVE